MAKIKIIPLIAHLVPESAELVFKGVIYDVYQWQQKMFDGTTETFEMLKRADTVSVIPIKNDKLIALKQSQPSWPAPKYGFPGGRVDPEDNTPLDAVKRELKEETGLSFRNWKLIDIQQREEKIEWFHYKYVASELIDEDKPKADPGEELEVIEYSFAEVKELAKAEVRMGAGLIDKFTSIDDLLSTQEYKGREVEI